MDLFDRSRGGRTRARGAGEAASSPGRDESPEETLQGTIEKIVFAGSDGPFSVARLAIDGGSELTNIVAGPLGVPVGGDRRVAGRRESRPRRRPPLRGTGFAERPPAPLLG